MQYYQDSLVRDPVCKPISKKSIPPVNHKHEEDQTNRMDVLRRLKIASVLCFIFLAVEVVGGILSGSLSILSDAAHLFADLASFVIAILASHLAARPPSSSHTYGYKRVEALAALFSVGSLAVVSLVLLWEALLRLWTLWNFFHSKESVNLIDSHDGSIEVVDGKLMSEIAIFGVIVNISLAIILGEDHVHLPGMSHDHDHDHGHDHRGDLPDDENSELGDTYQQSDRRYHGHHHNHNHDHQYEPPKKQKSSISNTQNDKQIQDEEAPLLSSNTPQNYSSDNNSIFSNGRDEEIKNINLNAAYLHVLGDLAMSVAVLLAGSIIWINPNLQAADPICTILFCIYVFKSTVAVIQSSMSILMEEVPTHVDYDRVYNAIVSVRGVCNVHDLHIWSISHGVPAMSVHVLATKADDNVSENQTNVVLKRIHDVCRLKFGILHSTIQVQLVDDDQCECFICKDGMVH